MIVAAFECVRDFCGSPASVQLRRLGSGPAQKPTRLPAAAKD